MKLRIFFLCFIFFFSTSLVVFGADNSLVLDLHLDNNPITGDTPVQAADSSIYKNHGAIIGATWNDTGRINGALSFDGLKDHVSIPASSSLNIAGTSPYSISIWVKGLGLKNNSNDINPVVETLMTKQPEGSCSGGYYLLYRNYDPNPNSNKRMYFGFSQGCSTESAVVSNKNDWEPDKWYNIVGTWDGTTSPDSMKLYVNGELDATTKAKYPTILQNTASLWMGAWTTGPNSYFKGLIDEVKIYRRVLSADEVKTLYNNLDDPLILNMRLDNNASAGDSSTKTADSSTYKNEGTISGAMWTTSGRIGQGALSFDGTDDYFSITHSTSLGLSGAVPFSIDLWVRGINATSDPSNCETLITKTPEGSCSGGYYIWYDNGRSGEQFKNRVNFGFHHGCSKASVVSSNRTNWDPTAWYHIVGTWDGTTNTNSLKLYINGELDAQTTPQYPTILGNTANLLIGKWGTNNDYLKGLIDEVKIYKRALSGEEIKKEYDAATPATTTTTTTSTTTTTMITDSFEDNLFIVPFAIMIVLAIFLFWAFFIRKHNTANPENESSNAYTKANFCPNCGSGVSQGDKFCRSCGKDL